MIDLNASATEDVYPGRSSYFWFRAFQRFLLQHSGFSQLAEMLGGEAAMSFPPAELYMKHTRAVAFLHHSLNEKLRLSYARVVGAFLSDQLANAGDPNGHLPDEDEKTLQRLDTRGYAFLPRLSELQLDVLTSWFHRQPLIPNAQISDSCSGDIELRSAEELRADHNLGQIPRNLVLGMPGLPDLVSNPTLLGIVRKNLCVPPILIDVSAWRSFCAPDGAKTAKDAQLFHYDQDDYRFCKVFIYLTDVDIDTGPHVFIPGSHSPQKIAACRPPEGDHRRDDFDRWYFKTLRKSEEDSIAWLGTQPDFVTGAAGTVFVANTEGIHRGEPPRSRDRCVVQLVFGITPFSMWEGPYPLPVLRGWDGEPATLESEPARYALHMLAFPGWPQN